MDNKREYFSIQEYASLMGMPNKTVELRIKQGRIKNYFKINRTVVIGLPDFSTKSAVGYIVDGDPNGVKAQMIENEANRLKIKLKEIIIEEAGNKNRFNSVILDDETHMIILPSINEIPKMEYDKYRAKCLKLKKSLWAIQFIEY